MIDIGKGHKRNRVIRGRTCKEILDEKMLAEKKISCS